MDEDDAEDDLTTDQIKETVGTGGEHVGISESRGGKYKSLFSE